ncbi:MAG: zinc ribbon domain-containing protein [Lachnospiraceae bacterium]|nr:zinc ribbon domain-containing protein [Lachnospiraceae bacterium]
MYCEQCGTELKENNRFCEQCGYPVNSPDDNCVSGQTNSSTQPVYYGSQPQVIVQAPRKGFNFFHFFVGVSIIIIGTVFIGLAVFLIKQVQMSKPTDEQLQAQADIESANEREAQEQQLFSAIYSLYCGNYEMEKVRDNGVWKNYNTAGEVIGFLVDFRNLYEFGSQTDMYSAPTITLSADSIDLTSLQLGIHNVNEFHYENISGIDYFIDDIHGFAIFHDGTYLYIGYQNEKGAWQGECAFR